jgi:uncharacterized membrane protein
MNTTQLINELRNRKHDRPIDRAIMTRAADEIERLRSVLETIADTGGEIEREQAREALGETK